MTDRKTVFITGANRGIGLGLTQRFLSEGHQVIAATRNPDGARELWELEHDYGSRCRIIELDVTSDRDLDRVCLDLAGQAINVLVNNAGVMTDSGAPFSELAGDTVMKALTVNTLAPLRVTQRLLPNLQASVAPVVAMISSKMGSLADNRSGGSYGYRISKAAVNMLVRSLAADFADVITVTLHPGWVKTDMGGDTAPLGVGESTVGLMKVILGLTSRDSGRFLDFRGQEIPW